SAGGSRRHLRPFPTRRSSDLAAGSGQRGPRKPRPPKLRPPKGNPWIGARRRDGVRIDAGVAVGDSRATSGGCRPPTPFASKDSRSEEHTSELQSRENLVCRLL